MFRPRLFHLETEEELRDYFAKHAGFVQEGVYEVAGIMANDTAVLYKKFKKEWAKDVVSEARNLLKLGSQR